MANSHTVTLFRPVTPHQDYQTDLEVKLSETLLNFPLPLTQIVSDYGYDASQILREYIAVLGPTLLQFKDKQPAPHIAKCKLKFEELLIQAFTDSNSQLAFVGNSLDVAVLLTLDERLAVFFYRCDTRVRQRPQMVFFLIYELYELFGMASERNKDPDLSAIEKNLKPYQDFCATTPDALKNALKIRYLLSYLGDDKHAFDLMKKFRVLPRFKEILKELLENTPHINFSFLCVDAGFFPTLKNINFFNAHISHLFSYSIPPHEMVGVDFLNADFMARHKDEESNQEFIMRSAPAIFATPGYEKFLPFAAYFQRKNVQWDECVHALRMMKARNSHELLSYYAVIPEDLLFMPKSCFIPKKSTPFSVAFNQVQENFRLAELNQLAERNVFTKRGISPTM